MKSIKDTEEYKQGLHVAKEYAKLASSTGGPLPNWIRSLEDMNKITFDLSRQGRIDYYKKWLLTNLITGE